MTHVRPLLLSLVLALVASAWAQAPDENTLVIAQATDATSLDPANTSSIAADNLAKHLWASLLEITPEGDIVPYLAESFEVSEDGTELTFTLREGLTCEGGEPLTAEDAAYTFERAADPENAFTGNTPGFIFNSLGYQGVRVDDELTFTVLTDEYTAIAPGLIAEVRIHCKDAYEAMTLDEAATTPVASGPYQVVEWTRDERLVMERNPEFDLREVGFDRLVWRVIPEASTRAAELIAGNVDIADAVAPDQVTAVNASPTAEVIAVQGTSRVFLGFNMGAAFDDVEGGAQAIRDTDVRVALQYAVDVPTICRTLLNTECDRATGMVNPPNDHPTLEPYPYDPETAERLLDEAGYPRGEDGVRFRLTIEVPSGRPYTDPALVIAQMFSDIGVETDVELQDFGSVFVPALLGKTAGPAFMIASGGAIWNAQYDMADLRAPDGATNYVSWTNPDWFGGWDRLAETRDPDEQTAIVNEMLETFYADPPWLLLYFQPLYYGVSERIDWEPRRDARILVAPAQLR
jgi:peptide/nickel transport system substrate-binding protein